LGWESGGPISASATGSTDTADAAHTTYSTGPAGATDTADSTYASGPAGTSDTAHSSGSARAADAADTTHSADATNATYTTNAANSAHSADAAYSTNAADARADAIPIEAVVVVDINAATAPAATPAVTSTPPGSHQDSRAEGEGGACRVVAGRIGDRGIGIHRRTVYRFRLILRHVYHFRIGRLHHDHALVFDNSGIHCLLLSGVQSALVLCLPAHALNGIHQLALLRQEGIAEISSPLKIICQ
jgi:hypothetical protein